MEPPVMFVLILAMMTLAPAYSQSIYASENPLPVGSNVTLFSQTSVTLGAWMFNDIIVMITPSSFEFFHCSVKIVSPRSCFKCDSEGKCNQPCGTVVGVQLSDEGATLTLIGVTRYDEGPFRCNVSNGISHETSLPVHLNISFGPSNTSMVIMPMKHIYSTGSNITLSCSAESSPPAMIQWMVNGVYLNEFTQQLKLEMVTESNSGNYKCLFRNTVTSRFTSTSAMIRILGPIAAVVVNHTGGPAKVHYPFTLRCEVTGTVVYIKWWKNGQLISTDNTTTFSMDNKTLNLNPVQHSDNGDYQCQAFNYVSNMTSRPYTVQVNYGPMTPVITGPVHGSERNTADPKLLKRLSSSQPHQLVLQ
ncbi:Carcinoembryonic antigen-related cell adhesion molecule 5 Carcinoembryonic antigen [Larimichthys crocea]|uniref:Carcinoembryonic antigen-related cell adhesion molecule 5 Carcinoembryonic antigen n=1 Tax=Larimichthys crocea TaxID=215358 RepID=A0A6G0IBZ6_LARCR|nr:Carcinoembryonic antigen-related cell adhesion molecule 5 Carcinoembryonic antigen [Larimichthys crocea]